MEEVMVDPALPAPVSKIVVATQSLAGRALLLAVMLGVTLATTAAVCVVLAHVGAPLLVGTVIVAFAGGGCLEAHRFICETWVYTKPYVLTAEALHTTPRPPHSVLVVDVLALYERVFGLYATVARVAPSSRGDLYRLAWNAAQCCLRADANPLDDRVLAVAGDAVDVLAAGVEAAVVAHCGIDPVVARFAVEMFDTSPRVPPEQLDSVVATVTATFEGTDPGGVAFYLTNTPTLDVTWERPRVPAV